MVTSPATSAFDARNSGIVSEPATSRTSAGPIDDLSRIPVLLSCGSLVVRVASDGPAAVSESSAHNICEIPEGVAVAYKLRRNGYRTRGGPPAIRAHAVMIDNFIVPLRLNLYVIRAYSRSVEVGPRLNQDQFPAGAVGGRERNGCWTSRGV